QPVKGDQQLRKPKPTELAKLRTNAVYTTVIWFAETRGVSVAEMSRALFFALWQPQAQKILSAPGRLRALTEISDAASAGVACQTFAEETERQSAVAQMARRERELAHDQVSSLERQTEELTQTLRERDRALADLNQDLSDRKKDYETALTFQQD